MNEANDVPEGVRELAAGQVPAVLIPCDDNPETEPLNVTISGELIRQRFVRDDHGYLWKIVLLT